MYEYCSNSRLKLPDILSCQAEARRLALTTLIVRFTDFLVHKSLFTKGFRLAAAEKLYDGATAETANVARALAIQNSTHWKRGVHAENFEFNACRGHFANAVERAHTESLDANDKLIQTRSHVRNTIASRKWRFVMRKGISTVQECLHTEKMAWIVSRELTRKKKHGRRANTKQQK